MDPANLNSGIGVDWASGNWLVVIYDEDGTFEATVEQTVEDVWNEHSDHGRIAIDVPIGLLSGNDQDEERSRACDEAARDAVGSDRAPSVFNAPARAVLDEIEDEAAPFDHGILSSVNEDAVGKGLSSQSVAIVDVIKRVDDFLTSDEAPDLSAEGDAYDPIVESHPEVCFRAFADNELSYPKSSALGVSERLDALNEVLSTDAERALREVCDDLVGVDGASDVSLDDALDALALAITAAGSDAELDQLPERPPTDEAGYPMQMVYRGTLPQSW